MAAKEKTVFDSPEFLAERRKWYKKLKKNGFKDIEYTNWEDGTSGNLLAGYGHMDAVRFYSQDVADYFYRANQYMRDVRKHWGAKSQEYKAWKIHSRGGSYKEISDSIPCSVQQAKNLVNKIRINMRADGQLELTEGEVDLLTLSLLEVPDETETS